MAMLTAPPRADRIDVLRADDELGRGLSGERLARAERASAARVIRRNPGLWTATADAATPWHGAGLLVVSGMLVRRVTVARHFGAELLSTGDLLQPWQHGGEDATVPFDATWRVLTQIRLAVLDRDWMGRMAPYPEVATALIGRALARSRRQATLQAIGQQRRLDERLLTLLWDLADRFGRVTPAGVRLDLNLTHELLGYLAGARRPSVSATLSRLEQDGRLIRSDGHWVLRDGFPT